ncbi:hypothetical protein [Sodalis glossinidius]|uniref:hypothetical protein n=1 Tax=Sodalis glossinidius TaxID=63612 RepID=UPI0005A42E91|nr:hypothetical protein [Sodalis glossinidius]
MYTTLKAKLDKMGANKKEIFFRFIVNFIIVVDAPKNKKGYNVLDIQIDTNYPLFAPSTLMLKSHIYLLHSMWLVYLQHLRQQKNER